MEPGLLEDLRAAIDAAVERGLSKPLIVKELEAAIDEVRSDEEIPD
jgi:hypothetical protein